jgi:hypothetical protein
MNLLPSPRTLLALALLGTAGSYGWRLLAAQSAHQPFTATSTERLILADGSEKYRFEKTSYRRSDGSLASNETRYYQSQGKAVALRFQVIEDLRMQQLTSVYPEVQTKMTSRLTPGRAANLAAAPNNCARAGFETVTGGAPFQVSGFSAIERKRITASVEGQPATEDREWVIPPLGCFVARYERRWIDDKGAYLPGSLIRETAKISAGEPPASIFDVPPGLREMSPSQVMTAQNAIQGRTCTECDRKAMENGDRAYFAGQR